MAQEPFKKSEIKIAVIGGGTGSFTLLSTLKTYTSQLAAIVNMADDGGSTGVLRDELGTLPPGDVRQCLVALSNSPKVRDLFNYRFEEGTFAGHSFGNLFLTAMEKLTGSFSEAVETASEVLGASGIVIPGTLDNVRLKMEWPNASLVLHGERVIDEDHFAQDPRHATLTLVPQATANPTAVAAIMQADIVLIAPGDLYTSLGPLLVIKAVREALAQTRAKVAYVCNLVTKHGQTEGFTVSDHAAEIERFVGTPVLDWVLYNEETPSIETAIRYRQEGAFLVEVDHGALDAASYKAIGGHFLGELAVRTPADSLLPRRSLIRHDAQRLTKKLLNLYARDPRS